MVKKKQKIICSLAIVCEEKKITVYNLAKKLGYHPNKFYSYIMGEYVPSTEMSLMMAKELKCKVEDIFQLKK